MRSFASNLLIVAELGLSSPTHKANVIPRICAEREIAVIILIDDHSELKYRSFGAALHDTAWQDRQ